jgi:hypothetical protein
MASRKSDESQNIHCGLTLEDEFVLTRIRTKAHSLEDKDRDQYLWTTVFKLICRERAYKTVMNEVGIAMDTNMGLFDDDEPAVED